MFAAAMSAAALFRYAAAMPPLCYSDADAMRRCLSVMLARDNSIHDVTPGTDILSVHRCYAAVRKTMFAANAPYGAENP